MIFSLEWNNHLIFKTWYFAPPKENLEYLDVIEVGKKVAKFIENRSPGAIVWTTFPSNYMLSEPFQGYISTPVKVQDCQEYKKGDKVDLIVFHPLVSAQQKCFQMIQELKASLLVTFEKNGKWMQIYKVQN